MTSPIIKHSEERLRQLWILACKRNDPKIDGGVPQYKRGPEEISGRMANFVGLKGEDAVAKHLDVPLDTTVLGLKGDKGYDLEFMGYSIQVKYNTYPNGDLYFNNKEEIKADLLVLTTPTCRINAYRSPTKIVGFCSKERFLSLYEIRNWGYGDRLSIHQDKLIPITKIMDAIDYLGGPKVNADNSEDSKTPSKQSTCTSVPD